MSGYLVHPQKTEGSTPQPSRQWCAPPLFKPFTALRNLKPRHHYTSPATTWTMDGVEALPELPNCSCCAESPDPGVRRCGCGNQLDPLERISEAALRALETGVEIQLPPDILDDPEETGYRRSILGRRTGQLQDYRMLAERFDEEDGRELHLREYTDRYTLHVDRHPARHPRHAVDDAPEVGVAAGVAVFAAVGLTAAASVLRKRTSD